MRFLNDPLFNATSQTSKNSDALDSSQMEAASVQVYFSDAAAAGTLKVQVSNDHWGAGNLPEPFTPTHWNDLSGASVTVAAGATSLIPRFDVCYQWIRLVWTSTGGAGTMTATV